MILEECGQVVRGHGDVGVVRAQLFLLDGQSTLVELFSFAGVAAGLAKRGQIVQVDRDLIVLRAENPRECREGSADQQLGFVAFALAIQERGQGGCVGRHVWMIRPEEPLANRQRSPRVRLAERVPAAGMLEAAEVVVERGGLDALAVTGRDEERERAVIHAFGFVEPTEPLVQDTEIVQHRRHLEIVRRERAFCDLERTQEETLGPSVVAASLRRERKTLSDACSESCNRPARVR